MQCIAIGRGEEGEPLESLRVMHVPVPEIGANEVLVLVMAAGVNFNGVWAARGHPVSVFKGHEQPFHIPGSDASGIVWRAGSEVKRWKVGDEVVLHCNQSCGECAECNGLDPMACDNQRIWGYETNYGSFAQFTRAQAQQLLPKPPRLSWEEAASYGLTLFTAYRMLISQAQARPGDNVLIWGAGGGLGVYALQLCLLLGANPIAVVSSDSKEELVRSLGCSMVIRREGYDISHPADDEASAARRTHETRRMGAEIRRQTGGLDADIVFEHVGRDTFFSSVLLAKKFGKIVICGATTGYALDFDVRYLWMRQKQIIGSHFANAYQAERANRLVREGKIKPVVGKIFEFHETARAHALMAANKHHGKLVIRIQAPGAVASVSSTPFVEHAAQAPA